MRKFILVLLLLLPLQGAAQDVIFIRRSAGGGPTNESINISPHDPVTENLKGAYVVAEATNLWRCTTNTDAYTLDCEQDVDGSGESWQSYDSNNVCNEESVTVPTEELRFQFQSPSADPTSTTDAQAIRMTFTKTRATCAANGAKADSTMDVWVYDGNSLDLKLDDFTCSGTDVEQTLTFTYEGASDGSEVYVEVLDNGNGVSGTNGRKCGIGYIEWYAEVQ